jgi:hypothetical protein
LIKFVRQLLATGQWFCPDALVSITNKTDATQILVKVLLKA